MRLTIDKSPLLNLSDEILMLILEHLPTPDLVNTFRTCKRLQRICHEKSLWRKINWPPDDYEGMNIVFKKCVQDKTEVLKIKSKCHSNNKAFKSSFESALLSKIYLPGPAINLTCLALISQKIDGQIFQIAKLPTGLKTLILTGTTIANINEQSHFFRDLSTHLPELQELELNLTNWITSHSLMPISKCPKLEKLSIRGCRNIGDCIAYISLSTRFGFKKLKVLDATNANLGSSELSALGSVKTLEELYCGQYDDRITEENFNAIRDICISSFGPCRQSLQILDISGFPTITDESLNDLAGFPKLKKIILHYTNITQNGINLFKNLKPNCIINKV